MNAALFLPTYFGEKYLVHSQNCLRAMLPKFKRALAIDSSSSDQTVEILKSIGFEVDVIPSSDFDHGGTRQKAVALLDDVEFIVFLTQDAIPASEEGVFQLLEHFVDPDVAIVYGRQLPRIDASPIEAHARIFSYPPVLRVKNKKSIPELGVRAAVVSNSFAAYRRSTLMELGGFPNGTLFGEDTMLGAKAILAGYSIVYDGFVEVYHSHDYGLTQEFQRYFDNGVFYSREKWILDAFGSAEGAGKKYLLSELKYLWGNAPWLIPKSVLSVLCKYCGYLAGKNERILPASIKRFLSMNPRFWAREKLRA